MQVKSRLSSRADNFALLYMYLQMSQEEHMLRSWMVHYDVWKWAFFGYFILIFKQSRFIWIKQLSLSSLLTKTQRMHSDYFS